MSATLTSQLDLPAYFELTIGAFEKLQPIWFTLLTVSNVRHKICKLISQREGPLGSQEETMEYFNHHHGSTVREVPFLVHTV